jgi:hypothetical protein
MLSARVDPYHRLTAFDAEQDHVEVRCDDQLVGGLGVAQHRLI